MWQYETTTVWRSGQEGRLHEAGNPEIAIATPHEFGGPRNLWSPENLLTGALGACLMTSTLHFLEKERVDLRSYMSNTKGTMQKTREGLAFTRIDVEVSITVGANDDVEKARRAAVMGEQSCPVSRALTCPVNVHPQVNVQGAGKA